LLLLGEEPSYKPVDEDNDNNEDCCLIQDAKFPRTEPASHEQKVARSPRVISECATMKSP
jgi:hypothetical protein